MNTGDQRAEEILAAAMEIADPAARSACLDRACGADAGLRAEVESLLAANSAAGEFLLRPAAVGSGGSQETVSMPSLTEKTGSRVGRYRLLEQIGEGGFGVVWMAEQEEPVRRRVALKIIKLGMDTKEVVARFEAERQALAMMDHPHIASVFDGGATDTGRPYFVMELVKGVPITQFCDERKLSTRERLELFMQVCQAVQHAHQKGIIHRDLKPSNVLVTVKDDQPVPKVIDFGVAKATQARLTARTLFTRFQQWIGTPAYMSPEQAGLGSLDVDTRSDIYSLGVLLYELLTGRTPFDTQKLLASGYDAVMRTIREEEPPKPSTRLSTLAEEALSAVAAQRGTEPTKLGRVVRGDLDWIVMKALEKDRQRRYDTAGSLAQDVARHLHAEPVLAAAPDFLYRAGKFIRRNRTRLAFATLTCFAVVLAVVGGKFGLGYRFATQTVQATETNAVFTLAKSGEAKTLARLLDSNPRLVSERDAEGSTPLIYAAGASTTNTLSVLIARGAAVDATNHSGLTALLNAANNNRTATALMLIAAGADPNHADTHGATPLHAAATFGAVEMGRALLTKGARTEVFIQPARFTPLSQAAVVGHADFVDLLLAHRASVEPRDSQGHTPLHFTATGRRVTDLLGAWKTELEKSANRGSGSEAAAMVMQQVSNRIAALETSLPAGSLRGGGAHPRVAEALLAHGAALELTNHLGRTPLLIAAQFTNEAVARVLVAHQANLNARDDYGSTPLNLVAFKGDVLITELLLKAGANANLPDNEGFTPLNTAIEHGHPDVAKVLLARGADPNLPARGGQAPMHTAAGQGDIQMLGLLLDHGAALHPLENAGTPLSVAVQHRQVEVVKFLLQRGAKPDVAPSENGMTSLHWAATEGRAEIVKLLLDAGATVDADSSWLGTPLNAAACGRAGAEKWLASAYAQFPAGAKVLHLDLGSETDYLAVLRTLLAAKANVEARERRCERTPIFNAVNQGQVAAVDLLLAAGADLRAVDRLGLTPLHAASEMDAPASVMSNIVARLLQAGASPHARDNLRGTPLHVAATAGKPVMVALLLEAGARFNAVGPDLRTPLQLAVLRGSREVVALLLAKGANPDWRDASGSVALHSAVQLGAKDIATLLLDYDADVDAGTSGSATNHGITALIISANAGNLEMMKLLLDHGAQLEIADHMGWTALIAAASAGHVDAARLLLDRHAKLEATDHQGNTPLMIAAKSGRLEMLKFLLDRDASSLTNRDGSGFTLLHGAADHGHAEVAEFLVGRGLDVNARSTLEHTPLHGAANGFFFTNEAPYLAVIKILLEHDANVNALNSHNQTPLHRAAEWGRPRILQALLAARTDPTVRDDDGKTALDIAKVSDVPGLRAGVGAGRKECEKLLRKAARETPQ